MIGAAIAPKATGAVLASSETMADLIGFMPAAISMRGRDRHRCAEAGQGLQQRAEAEGDEDGQDPLVVAIERMVRPSTSNHP